MIEYYLTSAEIDILTIHSEKIAKEIPSGSMIVELGSGLVKKQLEDGVRSWRQFTNVHSSNLRKVSILLQALEAQGKSIDYYALDLSRQELERTLAAVPKFEHVKCYGLHGTYDDGLEWLSRPENASRPRCIMSLGSSIGNFGRSEAAAFLKSFTAVLGQGDTMLIGLDSCDNPGKV